MSRLSEADRARVDALSVLLRDPVGRDKNEAFKHLGEFIARADAYDPLPLKSEVIEYEYDVFEGVWMEAETLRRSGALLALGGDIECPVVAVHGDYDPHPFEGVREPLSRVLQDFRFHLLERCGHRPWLERAARDRFYDILRKEIATGSG
jgi:pimeloyl-ACP methyl ester carboxylesterase